MADDTPSPTPPTQLQRYLFSGSEIEVEDADSHLYQYDFDWSAPMVKWSDVDSLLSALRGELAECRGIPDSEYGMPVGEYIEALRGELAVVGRALDASTAALASAREERLRWIVHILKARDAFALCEHAAAFHELYQIASPDFTKLEPWAEFEQEAALAAKEGGGE